jgi:hypothetical protein
MSASTTTNTEDLPRLTIHDKFLFCGKLSQLCRDVRSSRGGSLEMRFDFHILEEDRIWLHKRLRRVLGPFQRSPHAVCHVDGPHGRYEAERQLYEAEWSIQDYDNATRTAPHTIVSASVMDNTYYLEDAEAAADELDPHED